jgi:hypothetical protein
MRKVAYILLILIIFSCQKEENTIPTYLKIDNITLDENNTTSNITDAWIYINDQLQGVYELPALFPVLETNYQTLRIKAGIKSNGIASTRITYPFYTSFIDDILFVEDTTIIIDPKVSYMDSLENTWLENNFESGSNLSLDTDSLSFSTEDDDGNRFGRITLEGSIFSSEIITELLLGLPQAGSPVFLELDYKSNTPFLVGVYMNFPQDVLQKDLLWINPKDNWNKIYINLTSAISEGVGAEFFKIFIKLERDSSLEKNELYLDNIKLVY